MSNEPVDTASKERRHQVYYTTLLLHHNTCPDLITDKLRYCFTLIMAMFFPLTIVFHTKDSSSNKSTMYECWSMVQTLPTISVKQGQQY